MSALWNNPRESCNLKFPYTGKSSGQINYNLKICIIYIYNTQHCFIQDSCNAFECVMKPNVGYKIYTPVIQRKTLHLHQPVESPGFFFLHFHQTSAFHASIRSDSRSKAAAACRPRCVGEIRNSKKVKSDNLSAQDDNKIDSVACD